MNTAIDDFDTMFVEPEQETTSTLTPVTVQAEPQVLAPDQLPDLDSMEEGFSLAAKYREFETEGEVVRAVLIGFTKMNGQNGVVDVAAFQNREGVFVNAGTNLVQQVRHLPLNTPVQITYVGKVKTKQGNNVKKFDVKMLKLTSNPAPTVMSNPPPLPPNTTTVTGTGINIPSKSGTQTNGVPFNVKGKSWTQVIAFGVKHEWWTAKEGGPQAMNALKSLGWTDYQDGDLDTALDALSLHYAAAAAA